MICDWWISIRIVCLFVGSLLVIVIMLTAAKSGSAKKAFEHQCSGVFEKRSNQNPKLTFNRNQNTGVQYSAMFSYHTGNKDTLLEYSGKTSEEECIILSATAQKRLGLRYLC